MRSGSFVQAAERLHVTQTTVTARVRVGSVRVSAHGVCRQAGRVGDMVRVRIDETGSLVDGRVLDASTVEVVP